LVYVCGTVPKSATYIHQQGPTSIRSHITTELTTHTDVS